VNNNICFDLFKDWQDRGEDRDIAIEVFDAVGVWSAIARGS
jgi:hypothetical protein